MTTTVWRAIRASVGAVLLVMPAGVLGRIAGRSGDHITALARVLGIRHLVQAAVTNTPSRLKAGTAVDGLHLATLALTAVKVGAWRRPALADGAVETVLLAGTLATIVLSQRREREDAACSRSAGPSSIHYDSFELR